MAARKLQTEIDKTLKKVAEGVEQFEDQYNKIQQSTNAQHKDKLEAELKTQIKKLQRLRDQIKTWLASNDIKDKKALTDNRKLIEVQMERFKACEKEMKTKAFSKEGLSAGQKLDPKEQLKVDTASFISSMVDELGRQVELTEAEVEQLQGGSKKSKKGGSGPAERIAQLEELNDRRNWHISRLELILRLMENGNLEPERVQSLKEDISYFVESNTEEDFEEDEGIYDELNLDEEEGAFGNVKNDDDLLSSHDSMSIADTSDIHTSAPPTRTPAKKGSTAASTTSAAASASAHDDGSERSPTTAKTKAGQRKPTLDGTATRPSGLSATSRSSSNITTTSALANQPSSTPSAPAPRAVPAQLPPIRYSAAAASAVSAPAPTSASVTSPPAASSVQTPTIASVAAPSSASPSPASQSAAKSTPTPAPTASTAQPSPEPAKATTPVATSETTGSQSDNANGRTSTTPALLSPSQQAASVAPLQALDVGSQSQQQQQASGQQQASSSPGAVSPAQQARESQQQQQQQSNLPGATAQQGQTGSTPSAPAAPRLPSSLADLVTSFESAKQKSLRRDNDLSAVHDILESGYSNIPQPVDAEKPKYYIPRNAYPTPHYYPQQPSPQLANPALFAKFDVDTLFYIFYYCQGTYMQYLAAQELKKQSWRFHKQYLTWFQRANEPQTITDEYEQGVYLYFDFEGSWAQRRKENFSFFYRHLEE